MIALAKARAALARGLAAIGIRSNPRLNRELDAAEAALAKLDPKTLKPVATAKPETRP